MNVADATRLLTWSHVGLRSLYSIYAFILAVWATFTLVPGFDTGLFHVSFWLALEILYLYLAGMAIGFGIQCVKTGKLDLERNVIMSAFCMFVAVLMVGKEVTHTVFASIELADGTSSLATSYYWFLVVFVALQCVLILMNLGAILQFYWYRQHLRVFQQVKRD